MSAQGPSAMAPHVTRLWERLWAYEVHQQRQIQVSVTSALGEYSLTLAECVYDPEARVIVGRPIEGSGVLPDGDDLLSATLAGSRGGMVQAVCRAQIDVIRPAEGMVYAAVYVEWGEHAEPVMACMRVSAW